MNATAPAGQVQTFWVLLSAVIIPIFVTIVLLILNSVVDPGSDAPLIACVLWATLHLPFIMFVQQHADGSQAVLLTIVQWTAIAVIAARLTQKWRAYEAIAFTIATILIAGIVSAVSLLLLGYPMWFQGI